MADEIKLKAPTVEQQVVVNINGEDKLKSFADTLDKISNNKNLQKYWKTQQDLINATADAYSNFQKKASKDNASELIKVTNALKAMSGTDLSHILPNFDKISKSMAEAKKVAGDIDSAFSVKGFKEAFDSFETLKAYGTDIQKLFSHFGVSSDIGELQQNVRLLEGEVEKLTRRLINARNANEELRNEFENFKVGSGFADKLDELDRLKAEMQNIRDEATQTFNQFLDINKIDRYDWFNDDRFAEYFEELENGTLTATDAIRRFKSEYSYLLEDSYKSSGDSFGLDQLQAFSTKLDSIFHQVEETSNKINDILSNGVIAKSVQNLSEDTTLSDSQRSIFGNILQDEESLKSITALFQKLIDETNQAKNTEVFNTEQFTKIESLFTSIESSLSSIKGVLVDVGDGEELSPLLKTINNIEVAVDKLSSSVKGIGFNMNIDVGADTELEAKIQSKMSNALQAYQRLFEHIKMSGIGGSIVNTNFFEFDINQFDTMMSKIQAYRKFIENMRNQVKSEFGGKDLLYTETDKKYWTSAAAAMGQLTKAQNEMNKSVDANPLDDLFGKTDLTGVIEQLNLIISKLDEISVAATKFLETFSQGLNVTTSVEEITKLTEKVKELEIKLAKVKSVSTGSSESNISNGNSSQINVAPTSITSTDAIQKENDALEETAQKAAEAATSKEKFSKANQQVKESADESVSSIKDETDAFSQIEWDKNIRAIQDYMDAVTKLNNLKAKDKNTGKNATNISRQEQEVEKLKETAYEARAALTSMINPHDVDIDTWKDWVNAMKQFDQASLGSAESLAKLEDALRNAGDAQKNYINSVKDKHTGYSNDYQNALSKDGYFPTNAFKEKVAQYQALYDKLIESANVLSQKDIVSQEQLDSFEELKKECESARQELTKMSASDKGTWAVDVQKEISKITKELHENSNFSDEAKQKLQSFIDQLNAGDISDTTLKKIHEEFLKITNAEKAAGREGKNFIDILKNSGIHKIAADLVGMFSVYDLINGVKQGINIIRDLDDAMTEVKKVSEATESQYTSFQKTVASTAREIANTNKALLNSSADFLRLGYSLEQAQSLAKNATLFVNVGDGVDITEATEDMITAMKAFDIQAEDSIKIVDSYNQIGNLYALSASDIGESMKRSASALETGNNTFEESIGLITAMNEIVQNSENTGNTLKVLSLRLRGAKAELESMSEDTDGLCDSSSKLREQLQALTGVDIMIDDSTFKSTADIVKELGATWDRLSDSSQAATLEIIAGKTRANNVAALLKNYQQIDNVIKDLNSAEGSALRENQSIIESINGRIKILSATAEEFWQTLIDKDVIKNAVSGATELLKLLTQIVDTFGIIPTIATGLSVALSKKGFGKLLFQW